MRISLARVGLVCVALTVSVMGARAGWFQEETPPSNAKPLSMIVKMLEDKGYRGISEVEFEDGKWEVEVHQAGGKELELHVDPISGQIASQ